MCADGNYSLETSGIDDPACKNGTMLRLAGYGLIFWFWVGGRTGPCACVCWWLGGCGCC